MGVELSKIIEQVSGYNPDSNQSRLNMVLDCVSENSKNGLNAFVRVLEILLPLKPDDDTIISVFLRDLYLDGVFSDKEIVEQFGEGVADLLHGLKKLEALN